MNVLGVGLVSVLCSDCSYRKIHQNRAVCSGCIRLFSFSDALQLTFLFHLNSEMNYHPFFNLFISIISSDRSFRFLWLASDAVDMPTAPCTYSGTIMLFTRATSSTVALANKPLPSQVQALLSSPRAFSSAATDLAPRLAVSAHSSVPGSPFTRVILGRLTDTGTNSSATQLSTSGDLLRRILEVQTIGF